MKMNMNNKKTMLALVLVAALALCSVAVVANASESDATDVSDLTIVRGDLDIKSSTTDSYGIYDDGFVDSVVTIAKDANYTGTLCFGTYLYDTVSAKYVFTPYVTLTLTGVSSAEISFDSTTSASDITIIGAPSGSIVISQGSITLGDLVLADYFDGTIVGNTVTVDAANIYGLKVTAGTTDVISGIITAGTENNGATIPVYTIPTVTVDGVANINNLVIDDSESVVVGTTTYYPVMTISENATVSAGAETQSYTVAAGETFNVTLGATTDNTSVVFVLVVDSNGNLIAKSTGALVNGVANVTVETGKTLNLTQSYKLYVMDQTAGTGYYYQGTLSFALSVDGSYNSVAKTSLSGNVPSSLATLSADSTAVGYDLAKLGTVGATTTLNYNATTYTVANNIFACYYDASAGAFVNGVAAAGTITFPGVAETGDTLYVFLFDAKYDVMVTYTNTVTVAAGVMTLGVNNSMSALTLGTVAAAHTILTGETVPYASMTITPGTATVTIDANAKMIVNGTFNVAFNSADTMGAIVNNGTITVAGKIVYKTNISSPPIAGTVNATYYKATGTTIPYTYVYTTLDTAMTESNALFISGTSTILKDTTLTGTSATANTITVLAGANVTIGSSSVSAVVSTLSTTTFVINGTVTVQSGKLIVAGLTTDSYGARVVAEVLVIGTSSGTYTDVVTALKEATSGSTVNLRANATIASDATVATGVVLNATGYAVLVDSGATFTINGELKGVTTLTVEGSDIDASGKKIAAAVLVLNSTKVTYATAFDLKGSLIFGSEFDNTATTATAFPAVTITGTESTIDIAGKVKFGSAFLSTGTTAITVSGTATFSAANAFGTIDEKVTVTGTFTVSAAVTVEEMIVGDSAKVGSSSTGVLTVETMTIGAAPTTSAQYVNGAAVNAVISDYVIIYGQVDSTKVILNLTATTETTAYYLNTDVLFATISCSSLVEKINNIADPAIDGYNFYAWYSSPSLVDSKMILNTDAVGDIAKVYGKLVIKTYTITLAYTQNGYWILNGNPYLGGTIVINWAESYDITFVADSSDYYLKNYGVNVNGSAMPIGYEPTTGDVISFSGTIEANSFTLTYTQNGYWIVNGNSYTGGTITIPQATSYKVSFVADNNYELKNYSIYVNNSAMPSNYTPAAGDVLTFKGTVEQKISSEGMEISTILLIIITIVIIIMAIVIALRLMRS